MRIEDRVLPILFAQGGWRDGKKLPLRVRLDDAREVVVDTERETFREALNRLEGKGRLVDREA